MNIGKYIKNMRVESGIGLRKFCEEIGYDPSNWSKFERGLLLLNIDRKKLERIANVLKIKKRSRQWEDFLDLAELTQNKIPEDMIKETKTLYYIKDKIKEMREELRISVPKLKKEKFKNVLLYILEKCAGKPNIGETVLYKLLYFIDFNYYEIYEEQLTGAKYRKLQYGPVPYKIDKILSEMKEEGAIDSIIVEYFGNKQKRYVPLISPDLTKLKASEIEIIKKTLAQISHLNANEITKYSHNDIPWKATKDKEDINYELVFYRTVPYSQRLYKEEADEVSRN